MHARALAVLLAASALAAGASGCGSSDPASAPGDSLPPAPTTVETSLPTTTAATETDGIDPLDGAGTDPVSAAPAASDLALLERVAIARHEGFDRVVFQFRNGLPGYRVEYVEPPLVQDGSGDEIKVDGNAFVVVRMEPASGFDPSSDGQMIYLGPPRISGADAGTPEVREVARIGDFEAVLNWAVGLADRVDFRVTTLRSPPRLVIDFRNH